MEEKKIQRAIISVSDKTGIVELARKLRNMGIEIVSTGGTAETLLDAGLQITGVCEFTGFPEMLDGRVKTLHPKIHAGILAKRNDSKHSGQLVQNRCQLIDMVVVNLYPFEATVANPDCRLDKAIENIDIGGPTLLRAAAKNFQDVVVIVNPKDYTPILKEMEKNQGEVSYKTRFSLMKKVYAHTAHYDQVITNYLARIMIGELSIK